MRLSIALGSGLLLLCGAQVGRAYEQTAVTNGGTLVGRVTLQGDTKALPPQPVFKHMETCGEHVADERLVLSPDGGIRDVVISLDGISRGKPIPRDQAVHLDNKLCAFVPHVVAGTVGQQLEMHNSDPFLHDAHALLPNGETLFNVALPKGKTVHKPIAYPGLVAINCNVRHTWMHAYLFAADHPYVTVTDATGGFRIADIPPGTYPVKLWQELLGAQTRSITVRPGETVTLDVELAGQASETAGAQAGRGQ